MAVVDRVVVVMMDLAGAAGPWVLAVVGTDPIKEPRGSAAASIRLAARSRKMICTV